MTFLMTFLNVLKIIGLILLGIVVLVLFILALVLFVPVRYKADGKYCGEKPLFTFKVSWLFSIVCFSFDLNRENKSVFKILGFNAKKKVKKKPEKTDSYYDDDELEKLSESENLKSLAEDKETEKAKETLKETSKEIPKEVEYASEEENDTVQKDSFYVKIKRYIELFKTDDFQKSYVLCKDKIKELLKHVLPRKWNIKCDYAFEDPATTGAILGFASAIYPFIRNHIIVTTDFGEPHINAKGYARGSVCIAKLLFLAGMVYFNRNIKKIIRLIKEV